MDLWVPNARVGNDESVVFQAGVNLFRGQRQLGGRVTVTDRRFLFCAQPPRRAAWRSPSRCPSR
jgi:hypothetical protein